MTIHHSLTFDAAPSARSVDENGFLHVASSHITKATVNPYYGREIPGCERLGLDPERIYYGFRDPEELRRSLPTWAGLPLHIEHHPDSADAPEKLTRVGAVGKAVWNAPYIDAPLTIWDRQAIDAIEDGSFRELSCAYRYEPDFTPGRYEGVEYDFIMRDIRGNHVALVDEGRAGPDVVVADAALRLAGDAERWITVHPNGANNTGRPALIDSDTGEVKAGMGGKFNGRSIDDIPRGRNPHPVTEEKYQARQQRQSTKQAKEGQAGNAQQASRNGASSTTSGLQDGHKSFPARHKILGEKEENGHQYYEVENPLYAEGVKLKEQMGKKEYEKFVPQEIQDAVSTNKSTLKLRADKVSVKNGEIIGAPESYSNAGRLFRDTAYEMSALLQSGERSKRAVAIAKERNQKKEDAAYSAAQNVLSKPAKEGTVALNKPMKIVKETERAIAVKKDNGDIIWIPKSASQITEGHLTHVEGWATKQKYLDYDNDSFRAYMHYRGEQNANAYAEKQKAKSALRQKKADEQAKRYAEQQKKRQERENWEARNTIIVPSSYGRYGPGDIVQFEPGGQKYRLKETIGRREVTEPAVQGGHLLGHEGEKHEAFTFEIVNDQAITHKPNLIKGAVMRVKHWFRGAKDADPGIERQEVDLAQAIIDLHKIDPTTGEVVDITEDEDKAAEIRKIVGEISPKLDPEELKRLTDALGDLAYSKATGDADPDDKGAAMDEDVKKAMDACGLDSDDEDASRAFAEGVKFGEGLMRDPAEREKLDREHESEGMRKAMDSCGLDVENPQESRAFAEGVKYGEKLERNPVERKKLDREHESEGMKKAMGNDEDKAAEIRRILDEIPGLTPEQKEQIEASLQDLAYSRATGDEDIPAQDRALRRNGSRRAGPRPLLASDAALIESRAVARAQDNMRRIAEAVRDVRPLVGELDLLAFDCASNVYGYALEQCGVDARRYSREAWRGMVDMLRRQKSGAPSGRHLAQDAAPGEMKGQFAGLNNISIGD